MEAERRIAETTIAAMQHEPWIFEMLPAYSESARDISLDLAARCDLFVQLVGPSVSRIVEEEYRAALNDDATKILLLTKEGPRTKEATEYLKRVSSRHKYGKYRGEEDLPQVLRDSVATWVSRRAKRTGKHLGPPETIFDKSVELWPDGVWTHRFDVEPGEKIRGLASTTDSAYTFDAYLFTSERDWSDWRNNPEAWEPDSAEVIAFPFNKTARSRDRWYLVIKRLAWLPPLFPMSVKVEIRKESR